MSNSAQKTTQDLLARAHSPDSVNRIYSEKIQHRSLILRPTSPPPATINARTARRKTRQEKKAKQKQRPKPLSSRERRHLGLNTMPKEQQKYTIYEPLNQLWLGYARELLGNDVYMGGPGAAAKLASAEFHGAAVEVVRSRCPGRVGIQGIVGTVFRVEMPVDNKLAKVEGAGEGKIEAAGDKKFVFDVLGDQMMLRSADRANKKFKAHFLTTI
ncbi:hypothetical protein G7Z17_g11897 [Cylindrodendrum hubeiense]|uniref:Ribonuclease P protein subunit n=1 Tax=Cylindrodendrum hubeiense TaxID=595255 RepID=A0A9P5L5Y7_9HYPO|nr:hypothetical protein G7Z17_g11897 [Cylindrodendrum hubeiense]